MSMWSCEYEILKHSRDRAGDVQLLTLTDEEELEPLPGPANSVATVPSESGVSVRDIAVAD